jgi:hypothetical protein
VSIPYYPGSLYTPELGLALYGMDEVLAENMVILDAAYGAGGSINVNGNLVEGPNLNNTTPAAPAGYTNVFWQYDSNGNISAYVSNSGGGSSVNINGSPVSNPNFNGTIPAAPANTVNVAWQVDGSGDVSANVPVLVPNKTLYVDNTRTDSFTPNGTIAFPFPTITAAINQVIANGDNATYTYLIDIHPSVYAETINVGNTKLYKIMFEGHGGAGAAFASTGQPMPGAIVQPASGNAVQGTSNVDQITTLQFSGLTFIGPVDITDSAGNLGVDGFAFVNCCFQGNVTITGTSGYVTVQFVSSSITSAYTLTLTYCFGNWINSDMNFGTANFTNSLFEMVSWAFNPQFLNIGSGSHLTCQDGINIGAQTVTVESGGFLTLIDAIIIANLVINSGGTFTNYQGTVEGTITNNGTYNFAGLGTRFGADIINAGTGFQVNSAATSGYYLRGNGTNFVSSAIQAGDLPSTVLINPMTTLGDTIYGGVSGAANRLAGNTTSTREFLTSAGISSAATAPVWSALVSGDIPNNAANTSGTAANLSGTPALPNGTTATTQTASDASTKIATDAFVQNAIDAAAGTLGIPWYNLIDALDYLLVVPWYNNGSPLTIDTGLSRISAGLIGVGTGAQGSIAGSLSMANETLTSTSVAPGTSTSTAGFALLQNTTPTVTGATTTVALSTSTAPINVSGNIWRYTFAATETGAGSNAWVNASVTISGYTTTATGNNGTFIVLASTTTTFDVTNTTGTTADGGTPVVISSAVVNSPILQFAGTINSGTAGALASIADTWSMQVVMGSLVPNPTSTLVLTHAGSTGVSSISTNATQLLMTGVGSTIIGSSNLILQSNANTVEINADGSGTEVVFFVSYMHLSNLSLGWQGGSTISGNNSDIALARLSPATLGFGIQEAGPAAGVVGGSLQATGVYSYGGLVLEQAPNVVATPTVTPTGGSATHYSYEVVALDINMQPIGTSAPGSTTTGVATLTTSAFNTITWTAVQCAYAYAVYRSASAGTPSTTGLLYGQTTLTSVAVATAGLTGTYSYASTAINAKFVGQYILVQGCANAVNNGWFYCLSATATSCVLVNPYVVAEASSPASATLSGGYVPAIPSGGAALTALSFVDYGWSANSAAAPTTNTHGGISWLSTYESSATGSALSLDRWTAYQSVASGLNGASTLDFVHSGSTGLASLSAPNINAVTAFYANGTIGVTQTAEAVGTLATIGGIVTTFTAVSDERLKTAQAYFGGLDEVLAITPIKFRWNEIGAQYSGQSTERDFIGFSAQNVREVIPEATWISKDDYLGFDDRPVIAALVNAVKQLSVKNNALEAKLAKIEKLLGV